MSGLLLAGALYDPLVAVNAEGRFLPYLAESFTSNPDYTAWVIRLRPNIKFSNGDKLDADAVVTFLNKLRDSFITGNPVIMISNVSRIDDLTLQITTKQPWATLPAILAGQAGYVVSPKQIDAADGTSDPIGTGPFKLKRWTEDKKFELVRNPTYWRPGLPYLDAVDFDIVPQGADRLAKLLTGEIDIASLSAAWDIKHLDDMIADPATAAKISMERDPSDTEKDFVSFNMKRQPLDDTRVRQAIAYATDIPAVAAGMGWPPDRLAQGPISPDSPFFTAADYPTYNLDRAKELIKLYLNDKNVKRRPKEIAFTLTITDIDAALGNKLIEQWAKAGIKVKLDQHSSKDMVRYAVSSEFDAIALRYFSAPDPDVLWHFFVSGSVLDSTKLSLNFNDLDDADITKGMTDGRARPDIASRKEAYARVQKTFAEKMPYLWLGRSDWRVAYSKHVRDARNVTLPDGTAAFPIISGAHRLTETWLDD